MLDLIKSILTRANYSDYYVLLWAGAGVGFLFITLLPIGFYAVIYNEVDKVLKERKRARRSRNREPEKPEGDIDPSAGGTWTTKTRRRRRKKKSATMRLVFVHGPIMALLALIGAFIAAGLVRVLSST